MLTLSNVLSFLRGPLALLLLIDNPKLRAMVVVIAMLSDTFDGFLARHYNKPTRFGAILDPAMDKFFVFFALFIFCMEGKLSFIDSLYMVSRDASLLIFGLYLLFSKRWRHYTFSSIKWGKVATALQFICLFFLSLGYPLPPYFYPLFIAVGFFVLTELFFIQYRDRKRGVI